MFVLKVHISLVSRQFEILCCPRQISFKTLAVKEAKPAFVLIVIISSDRLTSCNISQLLSHPGQHLAVKKAKTVSVLTISTPLISRRLVIFRGFCHILCNRMPMKKAKP
jgi:hypothetical protein